MTVATDPGLARLVVGIGELDISDSGEQPLVAIGVGSCIIICAWDRSRRLGAMAHVVQPWSAHGRPREDARYGDQAVRLLLRRMAERGARTGGLIVKIVGGASVLFGAPPGGEPLGIQNAQAVEQTLARYGIQIAARDVGGRRGRTVTFDPSTGEVLVRTLGGGEASL
jgi:chemotaxis protein CheD